MDLEIIAKMPMRPHLLKFIQYRENLKQDEILDVNNGSPLSYLIYVLCTNKNNLKNESTKSFYGMENDFTASLRFRVNSRMQSFNCYFFTRDSIFQFNTLINRFFCEHMVVEVFKGVTADVPVPIKTTILKWMYILDLHDDIYYDSIKKAVYRYRKNKGIKFPGDSEKEAKKTLEEIFNEPVQEKKEKGRGVTPLSLFG